MIAIIWIINQPAMKENSIPANCGKIGMFLILGGVFGNAFDRIFRKEGVVDFIRFKNNDWDLIFNIADVGVYFGEIFLIAAWIAILSTPIIKKVVSVYSTKKTISLD